MKCLERNKQKIKVCLYQGKSEIIDSDGYETGEFDVSYSAPMEIYACVSSAHGYAQIQTFGTDLVYDKTITIDNTRLPIDENTLFFIDEMPKYDHTTKQVLNKDYSVKRISKSLNLIVVAVAKGE